MTLRITPTTLHATRLHLWNREISGPLDTVSMAITPAAGSTSTATLWVGGHTLNEVPVALRDVARTSERDR